MWTSFTGVVGVDDLLTLASSCGLLEAQERSAKGPGGRWTLGLALEVENCRERGFVLVCVL